MSKTIQETRPHYARPIDGYRAFARILPSFLLLGIMLIPGDVCARRIEKNFIPAKYSSFVMDAQTGQVLHRKNGNKRLHPASLTKLMTLLMVFDALEKNDLKLHDRISISRHAASMSPSKLNLPVGATIRVDHAILALVTKSANDIAVALAEKLGKTERNFSFMMNRKARSLGMRRTHFRNASGLHHPKQISTARDMAILAQVLVNEYDAYYHYFSTKSFTYKGRTYYNHNKLMRSYEGMDGMKTGYIRPSGFNLVASAIRGNHRLIGVVFGGRTGPSRNAQMKQILDASFKDIAGVYILSSETPKPTKKPLYKDYNQLFALNKNQPLLFAAPIPRKKPASQEGRDSSDSDFTFVAQNIDFSRLAMLDSSRENSMFNRMIGEGDYDVTVRNRIETGLIAISAHSAQLRYANPNQNEVSKVASLDKIEPSATSRSYEIAALNASGYKADYTEVHGKWSLQVGAFTSREKTEKALTQTLNMLPTSLITNKSRVAPLKTAKGWIYRARLEGYSKAAAKDACSLLPDCIALAPAPAD